ncbi:MAG: hypothetical protein FJY06_03360 [Bacteroidetes bacterium]|nr:hypothetical protein [Bacteroidota bacterium]
MINSTIGKYKITRLIGEGGMASVYEAEHEMLGTKVAVKVLNPILSANTQIRDRFKNEAKMMASFNHPNITKIIDFDEQPHQLSIVMEFLEGEDLNEKIKRSGPLSQGAIKDIFLQTLSAFQYAHEKGVVHRDIKPSNIYVLPNGHVKILDFGIAKLFGQGNEMTQTGTQMGTPIYMSPEQVKADKSIDHRSDIYSLGVTMYYAITGKPPYNSDTTSQFDIFNKIVFEALPELPDVGNFDDFVKKACQKDRDQRFQSCEEWLETLISKTVFGETQMADKTYVLGSEKKKPVIEATPIISEVNKPELLASEEPRPQKKTSVGLYVALGLGVLLVVGVVFWLGSRPSTMEGDLPSAEVFPEITIGPQVWMKENLNVSTFRNGDPIPEAKTDEEWIRAGEAQQPAWCYYNNDPANGAKYGKMYNWFAVNDPRGLAPKGYHIPSDQEWSDFTAYLGDTLAGIAMKSTNGWNENGNGTNTSGFSGLPGGYRGYDGSFNAIGEAGFWWSSTEDDADYVWGRTLGYDVGTVVRDNYGGKEEGFSVRCLRD